MTFMEGSDYYRSETVREFRPVPYIPPFGEHLQNYNFFFICKNLNKPIFHSYFDRKLQNHFEILIFDYIFAEICAKFQCIPSCKIFSAI